MESGPTQAVLPLVGLAAEKVMRDQSATQAVGFARVESGPAQAVLPLVGLAAEKVMRDQSATEAVGFARVESGPTQAVLPLVGLAAEKVMRDRSATQAVGFVRVESGPARFAPLRRRRRTRRGLAPVELVLWLPVLLMVMALMVNYANMTSWRIRGEVVARDAAWRSRWPRSGSAEPRPPSHIWPDDADMGRHGDSQISPLNHPDIQHPVVRGPVLELGSPARRFLVKPLLDQEVGAIKGTSSIDRPYDLLSALGRFRSGEIANRLLTKQWQCAQMGFPNRYRRSLVLYDLPRTDPGLPDAYVRAIIDLLDIPHYEALSVLDRDEDWKIYHGTYPSFHPRIRHNYGETDPEVVFERSVKEKIDHVDEDGEVVLGEISRLPRRMTKAYLSMYEGAKQEIEELEAELGEIPPPSAQRRQWILDRLEQLGQIENLDQKIEVLRQDQATLDARENEMKSYVRSLFAEPRRE
ncbi:MAG: TadE family protein [Planctomycetota bacterium]